MVECPTGIDILKSDASLQNSWCLPRVKRVRLGRDRSSFRSRKHEIGATSPYIQLPQNR